MDEIDRDIGMIVYTNDGRPLRATRPRLTDQIGKVSTPNVYDESGLIYSVWHNDLDYFLSKTVID